MSATSTRGLRTAGIVDITTKAKFDSGGSVDLYGESWKTLSPHVEYGGGVGDTQFFVAGRFLRRDRALENATTSANPIHERTTDEKFVGHGSTLLEDSSAASSFRTSREANPGATTDHSPSPEPAPMSMKPTALPTQAQATQHNLALFQNTTRQPAIALDEGQFGQAVVLNEFNYAHGFNRGAELKFQYVTGGLRTSFGTAYR